MSLSVPSTITLTVLGQEVAVVEECVYLGSLVHSSTLSLFGHIARMPDETDARSIITPLRRTGGDHQDVLELHGWMKTIQQVSSQFAETRFAEIRVRLGLGLGLAFRRIGTEPSSKT